MGLFYLFWQKSIFIPKWLKPAL